MRLITTFLKRADHDALCRFFPLLHRETENANWTAIATTRWGFVLAFHWNRFYFIKKIPWWRASRYRNSFTWGIVRFQQVITFKIPAKLLQHLLISHIFSILSLTLKRGSNSVLSPLLLIWEVPLRNSLEHFLKCGERREIVHRKSGKIAAFTHWKPHLCRFRYFLLIHASHPPAVVMFWNYLFF